MASTGGKQALFNAIQVLVDHGDEVILPVPYWVSFKDMVRYCGGSPGFRRAPMRRRDSRSPPEMVERAITPRTRLIVLNSPSNPSGAVISPEDLTAIVRLAAEPQHFRHQRRVLRLSGLHRQALLAGLPRRGRKRKRCWSWARFRRPTP